MPFRSELAACIARHSPQEGVNPTAIDGLSLYRAPRQTPRQPVVYRPSICVVAQGHKRAHLGSESYAYDPDNYLLNSLTLPMEAEVCTASAKQPYLGLSLAVDTTLVSQLMLQMDGHRHFDPCAGSGQILSSTPITPALRHSFVRLVELTGDAMDREILSEGVKREIFYAVLKGPQGGLLRNCISNHRGANRIAPVVHYLEHNFHRALDIDTIAAVARLSPSALHEQFKAFTSFSPMQFVKNLRLHQARSLLLAGTSASEASYRVGYCSPSQFSREFKRLFGCSPKTVLEPPL